MLDITPQSHWLPLQPLSSTAVDDHASTSDSRARARQLPGCTCSIEALRDTFTPLYYTPSPPTPARTSLPTTTITHASTRDLPELLRLHAATLPIRYDPAFFLSLLLNSNYTVLIAKTSAVTDNKSDNTILACATAFHHPHSNELELLTLCVDPKYGRNGLATSLLQELASTAISSSSSSHEPMLNATLRAQITNLPAINLYTKLGFTIESIEMNYYARGNQVVKGGISAYKMRKCIQGMA